MKGHKANPLAVSLLCAELNSTSRKPFPHLCHSPHMQQCGWAKPDSLTLGIRCLELANEACRGIEERTAAVPKERTLTSTAMEHADQRVALRTQVRPWCCVSTGLLRLGMLSSPHSDVWTDMLMMAKHKLISLNLSIWDLDIFRRLWVPLGKVDVLLVVNIPLALFIHFSQMHVLLLRKDI